MASKSSGTALDPNSIELKPTRYRVVIVLILLLTLLIAYLDRVNVSVLLTDNVFLTDMGIKGKPVQMGLLMTMFLIAYGLSNVILSPIGDWLGPRKAMTLSIVLWAFSLFLGGIAATFTMMLAARVILGLGEGMHWPMQGKYVKNWFPSHERGKANAVWVVGLMAGPAIAMPFLTWVIHNYGWHTSFFCLVAFGLIPMMLLWFCTTDLPSQHPRVNKAELAIIDAGQKAEKELEAQAGHISTWDNMKVFIFDYHFWLITLYYFCLASIFWGTMSWLPSYLKVARGFSWSAMGALSSLPYVLGMFCVLASGFISDKIGRRAPVCCVAMIGAAIGIYAGANATSNLSAAILISVGIAFIGFGIAPAWAMIQDIVPSKAVGAGTGMMNGVSNGGSAFAPVIMGWLIAITGSYVGGLMYLVGLALLAACFAAILAFQKY